MLRVPHIAVAAALFATAAVAEPAPGLSYGAETSRPAAVAPAPLVGVLTDEEMRQISGGQEVVVEVTAAQTLTASSSGNSITTQSYVSGDVTFSSDALDGFNGIGNFVVNTGANNTLQGSINVSVATVPSP